MNIKVMKGPDESSKAFLDREWIVADKEHYGEPMDWDKHDAFYIKAMDGDRIVGVLDLVVSQGVAKIKDIIVDHKLRKQGIGRKLMEEAERMARKVGAHKMFLETGEDWEARKFYKSLGYKVAYIETTHFIKILSITAKN
jgi:GNAT superfamily N-acetyltransferase